jgi:small GTP-binding protein
MTSFLNDLESAFASLGESILPMPPSRPSVARHSSFAVALLGEPGVGKSCLFSVFCADEYQPGLASSESQSSWRDVTHDALTYRLRVTDHPGHVRHREAIRAGLAQFDAFIVVYDVSSPETLAAVEGWVDDIRRHSRSGLEDCPIVLAGNKCDMPTQRVSLKQGQDLGTKLGTPAFVHQLSSHDHKFPLPNIQK